MKEDNLAQALIPLFGDLTLFRCLLCESTLVSGISERDGKTGMTLEFEIVTDEDLRPIGLACLKCNRD